MNSVDRVTSKSIITDKPYCLECGSRYNLELHHCIHGAYRKKADKDGLFVLLCNKCHKLLHSCDYSMDLKYKKLAQEKFEEKHSREEFIERYGKNYLED